MQSTVNTWGILVIPHHFKIFLKFVIWVRPPLIWQMTALWISESGDLFKVERTRRTIACIWFPFFIQNVRGHPYPIAPPPPHSLSHSPFHAFNVVLVSCGHFISHFGQIVISSLSMPMVSNRPNSFVDAAPAKP